MNNPQMGKELSMTATHGLHFVRQIRILERNQPQVSTHWRVGFPGGFGSVGSGTISHRESPPQQCARNFLQRQPRVAGEDKVV